LHRGISVLFCHLHTLYTHPHLCQAALLAAVALYSGLWLRKWLLAPRETWPHMGWFCALLCAGSSIGAASWVSLMYAHASFYEARAPGVVRQRSYTLTATACQWFAVFYVCYGLQLLCFTLTKLMLLHRLTSDAPVHSPPLSAGRGRGCTWLLPVMFKATAAAVVLCSVVAMVAYDVAAAYEVRAVGIHWNAAAGVPPFFTVKLSQ